MRRRVREADKETRSGSGELLDTFIERSVIVPALVMDIGCRVWCVPAVPRDGACELHDVPRELPNGCRRPGRGRSCGSSHGSTRWTLPISRWDLGPELREREEWLMAAGRLPAVGARFVATCN